MASKLTNLLLDRYSNVNRPRIGVRCYSLFYGTYTHERPVFYEDQVIRRVNNLIHSLSSQAAYQLTRRPYRINWFINQLAMSVSFALV